MSAGANAAPLELGAGPGRPAVGLVGLGALRAQVVAALTSTCDLLGDGDEPGDAPAGADVIVSARDVPGAPVPVLRLGLRGALEDEPGGDAEVLGVPFAAAELRSRVRSLAELGRRRAGDGSAWAQAEEARRRAETLARLGETLTGARSPEDAAREALAVLGPALCARALLLVRLRGERLELGAQWGELDGRVTAWLARPGLTLADVRVLSEVARGGGPLYLTQFDGGPHLPGLVPVALAIEPITAPSGALQGFLAVSRPPGAGAWPGPCRDLIARAAATLGVSLGRAEAQRVLDLQAQTLTSLARSAPIIFFALDGAGVFELSEGQGLAALGLRGGELVGRDVAEVYAAVPEVLQDVRRALGGEAFSAHVQAAGRVFQTWYVPRPGGGVVGVSTDLTERVALEAQLTRTVGELRRSNAELERFAFVASHDLQGPLRTVSSFTELLGRELAAGGVSERAARHMAQVQGGAARMKTLIDDLLAYARLGQEDGPAPRGTVELGRVVQGVLADLEADIAHAGARVHAGPLPAVSGDEGTLRQLLANLLGNALKFRRAGVPPEVRVRAQRSGSMVHLTVADNGIGIEDAHLTRIFEIFARLHPRQDYEGNGIGLAVAKKIAEAHGGRLWAESAPGQGSTFHLLLPGHLLPGTPTP